MPRLGVGKQYSCPILYTVVQRHTYTIRTPSSYRAVCHRTCVIVSWRQRDMSYVTAVGRYLLGSRLKIQEVEEKV